MMDPGPSGGGARRGKRRRPNNSSDGQGGRDGGGGRGRRRSSRRRRDNRGAKQRTQDKLPPTTGDESSILGGRVIAERTNAAPKADGPPDAFGLFCSYFLGVSSDESYSKPNVGEIARRHNMTPEEIEALLVELDLEPSVVRSTVDLEGALLDIRVAPAGISRVEIARDFYEEYVESRAK